MQNTNTYRFGAHGAKGIAVAIVLAIAFVMVLVPANAFAFEVTQCSARPNADASNEIMGNKATRITLQADVAADERISSVTLTVPEDTTFSLDSSKVTLLTGADLMTRVDPKATLSADGSTITAAFAEPVGGGALRVEIYDVKFPIAGGDMQVVGTYTTADGQIHDMQNVPVISVVVVNPAEQISSWLKDQPWVQAWNSNKFLKLFFDPTIVVTSLPIVFSGFLMALGIVAVAFPVAIPIGLMLALMRMSSWRILRGIATTYVNVVRGTPLFLQIYIAFFGLPLAGVQVPAFPLGVIVLSMNSAAYLCEIFRAGIQSIPKGQTEASRSLGMNGAQTMIFVIIPQTIRRVIPTMTSEFILLYKDTSMLAAVGVMEVVMYAKTIVASTGSITPYIVAAFFYLIITLPLAKVVGKLEGRLAGVVAPKKRGKKGTDAIERAAVAAVADEELPISGTDSAGVTGFNTDALTSQPILKHVPGSGARSHDADREFGMKKPH